MVRRLACACALLCCASSVAAAQDTPTDRESLEADAQARVLFQRGLRAYEQGDFDDAYASFQGAYELSPRPELLFNVGQAADRLGRSAAAREAFSAYLEALPDASNRAYVEGRLRVLEASDRAEHPAPSAGAPHEPAPVAPEPAGPSPWPFVALGAAAVSGGLAIYFWIDANAAYDDLDQRCGDIGCTDAQIDASGVQSSQTVAQVLLGASAAALTVGIGWLVLDLGGDGGEGGSVQLEAVGAGLRVRGRL